MIKIRKATKKDVREISEIFIEESSKKPYNEKYTLKTALKDINDFLKNELYVAINKKEIMGFIASEINNVDPERVYVNELWLREKHQGKGVGSSLVKFMEKFYKKKGVKLIRLSTKKSAKAFNFYKKIKYHIYEDLVYMEKKLK